MVPKGVDFPYAFFYLIGSLRGGLVWRLRARSDCLPAHDGGPSAGGGSQVFGCPVSIPSRLILLVGVSLLISKVSRDQQRARRMLRSANEELDKRVQSRTQDLAQAVKVLESEVVQRERNRRKNSRPSWGA